MNKRFNECCNDPEIEEQDNICEPMFFCCNCGVSHNTPIRETDEYLALQAENIKLSNRLAEMLVAYKTLADKAMTVCDSHDEMAQAREAVQSSGHVFSKLGLL